MRTGMNAAIAGTSSFDPTAKPTTLPMLLNQIQALACELRASTDCVADNLSGPEPTDSCEPASAPNTIMSHLYEIRDVLTQAKNNQRRVTDILAL